MVSARVNIFCTDGTVLRGKPSYFIREKDLNKSRVTASSNDPKVYIHEFVATSKANNDCLISVSVYKGNTYGILRSRGNKSGDTTPENKDFSVSESYTSPETEQDAAVRGIMEELGCVIDVSFLRKNGSVYDVLVDPAAKAKINSIYNKLKPITELYDVDWKSLASSTSSLSAPTGPPTVTDTDITESSIVTILASPPKVLPNALPIDEGGPFTPKDPSYMCASHTKVLPENTVCISSRTPLKLIPRTVPPPTKPLSTEELIKTVPNPKNFPPPNPGESLSAYVKRVGMTLATSDMTPLNNYGKSIGLTGGRTIRQKKSKHSKKRGTLKRGNRR
jgi:hypothetical protein